MVIDVLLGQKKIMSETKFDECTAKPVSALKKEYWYLKGQAYDFTDFVEKHPGGKNAIMVGKGIDCTCLFMSYHPRMPSAKLLEKYIVEGEEVKTMSNGFGYRFDRESQPENKQGFYREVWAEANAYLKTAGGRTGGFLAVSTWLLNLSALAIAIYFGMMKGHWWGAAIYGVGKSLLIVRSTHACSHYSFTNWPRFNQAVYAFNMLIAGDTPAQWTAKHVVSHHIDCNVAHFDDDSMYPIKRALPNMPRLWFHKYQPFYIWAIYLMVFIPWTISHNIKFILGLRPDNKIWEGQAEVKHRTTADWAESWFCVLGHWCTRAIPFYFLPVQQAFLMFMIAEVTSSVWFSLQFAVNHEVAGAMAHAGTQEGLYSKQRDFGVHQVLTSNGYGVDGFWSLHLSGGLNTQVEHHLFPSVHYRHYRVLSKIVRRLCKKYTIPYAATKTFAGSVVSHMQLLWQLGHHDGLGPLAVDVVA